METTRPQHSSNATLLPKPIVKRYNGIMAANSAALQTLFAPMRISTPWTISLHIASRARSAEARSMKLQRIPRVNEWYTVHTTVADTGGELAYRWHTAMYAVRTRGRPYFT